MMHTEITLSPSNHNKGQRHTIKGRQTIYRDTVHTRKTSQREQKKRKKNKKNN